ncbi:DUF423 domain-containing protein [Roseibium sp.]|uniref:DUF423 domain-containing protein n=1 Tax=Roseibium sp. TaxID=1936156 RepID=UPI003A96B678
MSETQSAPAADSNSRLLRPALVTGGISGALGVALMAVSAHVDTTGYVRQAAEMFLFHAPALLVIGVLAQARRIPLIAAALVLLIAGLALFCGDLLSRAFFDQRLFPMSAPTGGLMLILGWCTLALSAVRVQSRR